MDKLCPYREHFIYCASRPALEGSPPHLRGKRRYPESNASLTRITPAPAGKTIIVVVCQLHFEDHPRTCGENSSLSFLVDVTPGSPPHLRGKHILWYMCMLYCRITPAPAGKTRQAFLRRSGLQDHPRTYGEN